MRRNNANLATRQENNNGCRRNNNNVLSIVALTLLVAFLFFQYDVMVKKVSFEQELAKNAAEGSIFGLLMADNNNNDDDDPHWLEEQRRRRRRRQQRQQNSVAGVDWEKRIQVKRQWLQYVQSQLPSHVMKKVRRGWSRRQICLESRNELENVTILHSLQTPAAVGYNEESSSSSSNSNSNKHNQKRTETNNSNNNNNSNVIEHYHAFIVPYRDRKYHLEQFLLYMSRYLQYHYGGHKDAFELVDPLQIQRIRNKIGIEVTQPQEQQAVIVHQHFFSLYVIEQDDDELFNRALLQNVGLDHVAANVECVIQHDVDVVPGFYSAVPYHNCQKPTHLAVRAESYKFQPLYPPFLGMSMTIHQQHWACINGMDNQMQGYGREDDELFVRLQFLGMVECSHEDPDGAPFRAPNAVGNVFTAISSQKSQHHTRGVRLDEANSYNRERHKSFRQTGLSPTVTSSGGWKQTNYHVVSRDSWDVSDEVLQGFYEIHHIKIRVNKSSLEKCFVHCENSTADG